jgi:hypothetical protein
MITVKAAAKAIARMSQIRYFPGDEDVRAVLMEDLGAICETDAQVDWLARRAVDLVREWTGVHVIWQIYFSKYPPRNERQRMLDRQTTATAEFPEGVPSEKEPSIGMLAAGTPTGLLNAPPAPVDREVAQALEDATQASIMPPAAKRRDFGAQATRVDRDLRRLYGELPVPPPRPEQRITADEVEEARRKDLERRAARDSAAKVKEVQDVERIQPDSGRCDPADGSAV